MMSVGGYHEYTGGCSGMFSTLGFPYKFDCFPYDLLPYLSLYPPGVLMISSGY